MRDSRRRSRGRNVRGRACKNCWFEIRSIARTGVQVRNWQFLSGERSNLQIQNMLHFQWLPHQVDGAAIIWMNPWSPQKECRVLRVRIVRVSRKTQVLVLLKLSGTNVQALFKEDLQDGWDEEPPSPLNVVFGYTEVKGPNWCTYWPLSECGPL